MNSATPQRRIGVYTPHLDGEYYGLILDVIHQAAQANGALLTVIQTEINYPYGLPIDVPVSVGNLDGCLLITNAAGAHTYERIADSGIPAVFVGYAHEGPLSHSVMVDNAAGVKEATLHLLDHGHRDIAFIGAPRHLDQRERLAGYREALRERNLPCRDELIVHVGDNQEAGGIEGAERLLGSGAVFTAVVAGTDQNAVGIMETLSRHGLRTPEDVAIVGFDNIERAGFDSVSLTTIEQDCRALAAAAADRLFGLLAGSRTPERTVTRVPARLIRRRSCGCRAAAPSAATLAGYELTISQLRDSLVRTESINRSLIQGLIRATSDERIDLDQLFWSSAHWGFLALWEGGEPGSGRLVVDRTFSRRGEPVPPPDAAVGTEAFPPGAWMPGSSRGAASDITVIQPVRSDRSDWGYLVLVGPFDRLNHVVINNLTRHSYTILAAALEREHLYRQVRTIADRLEVVSRTTNDGIWDWDITGGTVEWSARFRSMLGATGSLLTEDPASILLILHPMDRDRLRMLIREHLEKAVPFQAEFRIPTEEHGIMWVYAAGEATRDVDGRPLRMVGSFADITKKKADEERIIGLAYHDTLTGLHNRPYLLDKLQISLEVCAAAGDRLAVLLIDLDRFKIVNDTLGHHAGDRLLRHTADILRASTRPDDTIARLGGDEFIILMPRIGGGQDAVAAAQAILWNLDDQPVVIDGQEVYNSASIGASIFPDHTSSAESLIKYADMAMYKAKENGRDQVMLYAPELGSSVKKRFSLANRLRKAAERNEFELYYQPQIELGTGALIGMEALLRWPSPDHGMVQPGDFIPLAEETGWIVPISNWVLQEACRQMNRWQNAGLPPLVMSVNISAAHFRLGYFARWVKAVLAEHGVDPRHICLEVTETTAIQDMEHSVQILKELAAFGVKIAVDDFGTGHSSLMLLKRLPIHLVKIDQSFVRDMTADLEDAAIVKAVIAMSHNLGLSVMAEGVETEDQLRQLTAWGCNTIQGYYIGKPMPAADMEAFMRAYAGTRTIR